MNTELNPTIAPAVTNRDRLAIDLKNVAADATGLIKEAATATAGDLAHARNAIGGSIDEARSRLQANTAAISEKAHAAATATDRFVKTHPWQTLGVTALAGLLIGLVISRR